jgi:hypothetical protein
MRQFYRTKYPQPLHTSQPLLRKPVAEMCEQKHRETNLNFHQNHPRLIADGFVQHENPHDHRKKSFWQESCESARRMRRNGCFALERR